MFKKTLATALLVCTIPAVASASWFLSTQARNGGGSIDSPNMTGQTVLNGPLYRSYTTSALPTVTINAAAGNTIRSVTVNGTAYTPGNNTSWTVPAADLVAGADNSVSALFTVQAQSVGASIQGGTVSPSSVGNIYYGYTLQNPLTFTFSPMAGYEITGIENVPGQAAAVTGTQAVSGTNPGWSVPGGVNARATVTFPAGYVFTGDVALKADTVNNTPSLSHILPQTTTFGSTVNIAVVANNISNPTYNWTYISGPANTISYTKDPATGKISTTVTPGPAVALSGDTTATLSFTAPATAGQYRFLVSEGTTGKKILASVNVLASYADAAEKQCQFCHSANNVGDANIGSKWASSDHQANGILCAKCHVGADTGGHPGSTFGTAALKNVCLNCHNSTVMPDDPQGPNYLNSAHYQNPYGEGVVYCSSCHDQHLPTMGIYSSNHQINFFTANNSTPVCTKCHFRAPGRPYGLYSSDGTGMAPHFAAAATTPAYTHNRLCTDCHGHNNAINGQWAQSGHGDVTSSAWIEGGANGSPCVRCHTTTGFINYSSFHDVAKLPTATGEVLACSGCHTSPDMTYSPFGNVTTVNGVTGTLRPIKPYPATYSQSGTTVNFQFSDLGVSNVCIPCHSGRVSGGNIQKATGLNNTSFFNSHYRAAAGVFYKSVGFQFYTSSARYADPTGNDTLGNPAYYEHFLVGTNNVTADGVDAANTGSFGPCVACHMSNQNDGKSVASSTNPGHTLHVFNKDASGNVTGVNNDICLGCHVTGGDPGAIDFTDGNGNFNPANVNGQIQGFNASLGALQALLQTKGIYYNSGAYPYFYNSASYSAATKDWTLGTNNDAVGRNNMGAAFNLNMLTREPGAYAHNRYYTKRLIFDAIDWLQNGALTGSINIAAIPDGASDGLGGTTPVFDITAATNYLGSSRP